MEFHSTMTFSKTNSYAFSILINSENTHKNKDDGVLLLGTNSLSDSENNLFLED